MRGVLLPINDDLRTALSAQPRVGRRRTPPSPDISVQRREVQDAPEGD